MYSKRVKNTYSNKHGCMCQLTMRNFRFPSIHLDIQSKKKWGFIQERKTSGNLIQAYRLDSLFPFDDRPVVYEVAGQREEMLLRCESSATDGQISV